LIAEPLPFRALTHVVPTGTDQNIALGLATALSAQRVFHSINKSRPPEEEA